MEELVYEYQYRNFTDFSCSVKDRGILRALAEKKAEIAALPAQKETIGLWKKLNSLQSERPMVWINEVPWHEMDVDGELSLQTSTDFTQYLEMRLRKSIYTWEHMCADMVVEDILPCYIDHKNTWFGIDELVELAKTDDASDIYTRDFTPQINSEDDLEKIQVPRITVHEKATEEKYQAMQDIFGGILKIEKRGVPGFWFAPWDELIRWWDVQDGLTDLILRPQLVHGAMERLTGAYLAMLDQYESMNLLALNNGNYRQGSGGLGYIDELPQPDFDPGHVRTTDMWGSGAAQIFSDVSPQMHIEFALDYEIRWMKRFGLTYYGCCEPLDRKIDIFGRIPNLRKISMSPWVDMNHGAERIGRSYVFSYKPSPAIFMWDNWDPEAVRRDLRDSLETVKGCNVEVIMKDVSSVKYEPRRLWEWAQIAREVVMG